MTETPTLSFESLLHRAFKGDLDAYDLLSGTILSRTAERPEMQDWRKGAAEMLLQLAAAGGQPIAINRLCAYLLAEAALYQTDGDIERMVFSAAEAVARLDRLADRGEKTASGISMVYDWLAAVEPELVVSITKAAADWVFDGEPM